MRTIFFLFVHDTDRYTTTSHTDSGLHSLVLPCAKEHIIPVCNDNHLRNAHLPVLRLPSIRALFSIHFCFMSFVWNDNIGTAHARIAAAGTTAFFDYGTEKSVTPPPFLLSPLLAPVLVSGNDDQFCACAHVCVCVQRVAPKAARRVRLQPARMKK